MSDASPARQPLALIALHWATVVGFAAAFVLIFVRELADGKTLRLLLLDVHRSFGMLVLAMTALRLVVRRGKSVLVETRAHRIAAAIGHAVLYLLLLALPVIGWAVSGAMGHAVTLFGVFHLPAIVATDPDLADQLSDIHADVAWALLGAVSLHALVALWHHYVRRDDVLRAMLPIRRPAAVTSSVSSDIVEVVYE